MTTLATTLNRLPQAIRIVRGPGREELFDSNRLVELDLKRSFTFELWDNTHKLEFSFHLAPSFWSPRTEVELTGEIRYCEPLDRTGRRWLVKVRFDVSFTEYQDGVPREYLDQVDTIINYNSSSRHGTLQDKRFIKKFMRWNEQIDGAPETGLYFNGRRVARFAEPKPPLDSMKNFPIEELDLGVRAYNGLKRFGVDTFGDLVNKTEKELTHIPSFGRATIQEIKDALQSHGLKLKK